MRMAYLCVFFKIYRGNVLVESGLNSFWILDYNAILMTHVVILLKMCSIRVAVFAGLVLGFHARRRDARVCLGDR